MQDIAIQNNGRYELYNQMTFFKLFFLFLQNAEGNMSGIGEMSCTILQTRFKYIIQIFGNY